MNAAIAMPCWVSGASGSGANQTIAGTTTQTMRAIHGRAAATLRIAGASTRASLLSIGLFPPAMINPA